MKYAASGFLMGTPEMLWFASKKAMVKTIIPKPEVGKWPSPRRRPTFKPAWPKSGSQG